MSEPEPDRKLADKPALRADQRHPDIAVHAPNITPEDADPSTFIKPFQVTPCHDPDMDLATIIRRARHKAKLTQLQLADLLGVEQSAISQWEKGKVAPLLATRIKLAETLKLPLADVLPEAGVGEETVLADPRMRRIILTIAALDPAQIDAVETVANLFAEHNRSRRR